MQSWGINSAIKLLTYSSELSDGKALYVSSNCHPVKALNREPAGHAFHSAALKLRGCAKEATGKNEDTDKKVPKEKDSEYIPSYDSHSNKGKKKSGKQQHDHYALLGLGNLRYLATEDQIRKSYREAALKHHPDKLAPLLLAEETEEAKQAKKDEIESHFKLIQEAYEILMDSTKRRIFDSTDEFDDEVPSDCAPKDFFKVFGPAFKRNARWSTNPRVPDLGDENTPLKEVDSFYSWWYSFKSWREFPEEEEHDIEQAESREEKRWMERENTKKSQKARKEEHARIRVLVDNAYKKDTRILKRKEEEKAMKLQKKEEKVMAKRKLEEEAAAAIEEERRRKEEEAKRAAEAAQLHKRTKEKEKKLLRKERSRLRTLSAPVLSERLLGISVEHVEDLCMSLNTEQLRKLCDKMENKEGLALAKVIKNGDRSDDDEAESNEEEVVVAVKQNGHIEAKVETNGHVEAKVDTATHQKKEKPWSKEEIDMLRKGTTKFPKGTSQRWEVISEYIGTGRSVEEILKATKTVLLQKPDSAKAFDSFLENRKPAASIASPLSTREELGEPIIATKPHEEDNSTKTETTKQNSKGEENNNSKPADPEGWSDVQERALVQALKTFPKETNQRWERVATAVPGKTMNQCKKKFAELKDIIRTKKPTA
ncbi:PREDICTED: dnaJ homolog subfamily C member 2-like [Camelina sativa]|uniref:DnaJ homolog subfamily C member 2-like n=1 Tax=Camelina sativa TaxID=90675 RepID=A0ABM0TAP6_CAMSA|nr:PREDICTED: dnaJ homolog subfamily C member 2-like [Camelina sativa]